MFEDMHRLTDQEAVRWLSELVSDNPDGVLVGAENEPVAVVLSIKHYQALTAMAAQIDNPRLASILDAHRRVQAGQYDPEAQ